MSVKISVFVICVKRSYICYYMICMTINDVQLTVTSNPIRSNFLYENDVCFSMF